VRRWALLVAIAWWAQGALCLLPVASAHAHDSAQAHQHAATPEPTSTGGHHSQDDPSCAEHCASLSRALTAQTPQLASSGSLLAFLPLDLFRALVAPELAPGSAVARGQPPPGLARANPILRT
jgi:hypothetical protein